MNRIVPKGKKIKTLYNLDGGGSTSFVYNGVKLNPNIDLKTEKNSRGQDIIVGHEERKTFGIFYWKW